MKTDGLIMYHHYIQFKGTAKNIAWGLKTGFFGTSKMGGLKTSH